MMFTSVNFVIFFAILLLLLLALKSHRWKKILLLISSFIFYAFWDWRFLFLIAFSTLADFILGNQIAKSKKTKRRKYFLISSIILNLGLLGFFKYFNFFIDSANIAFGELGLNLSTLNIILPVGISFYTFQTMSYTIDIYNKKLNPSKSILDFSLFVSFFPQLVAGPIVRASQFLPQLKKPIQISASNFKTGIQIFLNGMFKKVIIADRLSYFVDPVFSNPSLYDTITVWLALVAYAIQIFCDFSGYSDMAIGLARILGFTLPANFNLPYISQNISEFWKRWHISLSSWLRDYVYIPLGGNRKGKKRTYINLMITMLLGGLWHGASWNFVFWGVWHGLGLTFYKLVSRGKYKNKSKFNVLSWITTLLFVMIGWIFFRASSIEVTRMMFNRMFIWEDFAIHWHYTAIFFIIPLVLIAHVIGYRWFQEKYLEFNFSTFRGSFLFMFIFIGIMLFYFSNPQPFIYFQF